MERFAGGRSCRRGLAKPSANLTRARWVGRSLRLGGNRRGSNGCGLGYWLSCRLGGWKRGLGRGWTAVTAVEQAVVVILGVQGWGGKREEKRAMAGRTKVGWKRRICKVGRARRVEGSFINADSRQ